MTLGIQRYKANYFFFLPPPTLVFLLLPLALASFTGVSCQEKRVHVKPWTYRTKTVTYYAGAFNFFPLSLTFV